MKDKQLEKAYKMVFDDLKKNSPSFFFGKYDAKNGKDSFMYGVGTVMECIALRADSTEKTYEIFSEEFTKNIVESKKY